MAARCRLEIVDGGHEIRMPNGGSSLHGGFTQTTRAEEACSSLSSCELVFFQILFTLRVFWTSLWICPCTCVSWVAVRFSLRFTRLFLLKFIGWTAIVGWYVPERKRGICYGVQSYLPLCWSFPTSQQHFLRCPLSLAIADTHCRRRSLPWIIIARSCSGISPVWSCFGRESRKSTVDLNTRCSFVSHSKSGKTLVSWNFHMIFSPQP